MSIQTFEELWDKLRGGDESLEIEAKRSEDIGNSITETISAFANEPYRDGGYLLLGIGIRQDTLFPEYEIVGVPDPDRLQQDLATKCREMFSIPIRPHIVTERRDGKTVVVVYIPEAQPQDKPVFLKSKGLERGSFRRIGSVDQHCTEEDLQLFFQLRTQKSLDAEVVPDTSLDDFDPKAIAAYRRHRTEMDANAAELAFSDEELLDALFATTTERGKKCATIAGLLLFGKFAALRRHFPMTRVDYIMVPGREWVANPNERYYSVEWLEPLVTLIPRVVAHVMEDVPKAFRMEDDLHRRDIPVIPQQVVREAIVNALMHRSYRIKRPTQIIRYANRIEIRNAGHSLKPDDRLGEPGSFIRNEKIASVLHDTPFAETKGTGIRTMRRLMAEANLSAPFFESDYVDDSFLTILLPHHLFGEDHVRWLARFADCNLTDEDARTLVTIREVGAMNNAYYRSLNSVDTLTASRRLQHLRDLKLLEQKGRGTKTYYVPGERFLAAEQEEANSTGKGLPVKPSLPVTALNSVDMTLPTGFSIPDKTLSGMSDIPDNTQPGMLSIPGSATRREETLPDDFPPMPASLVLLVARLGKRTVPRDVRDAIVALCQWRELRPSEIAALIGRSLRHTQDSYLYAMVRDGELEYVYPEDPQHPKQAYRAPNGEPNPNA